MWSTTISANGELMYMEGMNHKLQQKVRVVENREPNPSKAIVDCQSVKNGTMVSNNVGFDSGKLVK
ncbi:hypothetical protein [Nostoc sp. ChiQUE01b]|uniref:hypothetical protein n=1 Tax=Nostoc sp. ChiQUE01b TaxID=3075376 RepID=UPI002AD54401|nr:hypothetical protein [Nostoc sp. ChiQUE01b]MDZ8261430.1 hypothetical protein [Nostoc sp. ChiQUE01b]